IDESIVGVPVLAQKLVHIQATIISKCLPDIVRKINDKLSYNIAELNKMPQNLSTVAEAMTVFMRIIGFSKESLRKILLRGELMNTRMVLDETKGIGLPNFLPRTAFHVVLQKKVKEISKTPANFIAEVWGYIETVVETVFMDHLEMEMLADYTCSPDYMSDWGKLMAQQNVFMEAFDMKMRITAYWKVVLKRFVDSMALHLLLSVQNLVNRDMEEEIFKSPSAARKREKLNRSIKTLKESKEVVAQIMDRITVDD
ncbi:hypothetical protein C3L33_08689, partial [Rhododendron williamsianum]